MKIKLIALNARYIHSCLALFYVRNELINHLPDCEIDFSQLTINDPYYDTLNRISEGDPAAIFFSVYIWNSMYVSRLLADIKKILPGVRIVLGGPQAAYLAGENGDGTLENCTVVRGPIEGVRESFYNDLIEGSLKSEYQCDSVNMFRLPYLEADFREELANRHIYYESSRGCPFSCTYCLSSARPGVCHKDINIVIEELSFILAHRPKVIRFVDRTFNDLPERALAIWEFLAQQESGTLFHFEIAPDRFSDRMFEFLKTLDPGRFQFEIGVQSTNAETLKAVNRKMDWKQAAENITRLVALDNVHIHADLILGLPYETRETFSKSFNDVIDLNPHYIQMGLLKVLLDTAISRSVDEFGIIHCTQPTYEILANRWLDRKSLCELYWFGECVEAFYNNRFFRSTLAYVRRKSETSFDFFLGLLEVCRKNNFFEKAHTQELMSIILFELAQQRLDKELLVELLRFDWLRSGHRFLPEYLGKKLLQKAKTALRKSMPQNLQDLYDYHNRDEFFRQTLFIRMSGAALRETGLSADEEDRYICFLQEFEAGVFKFCKVMLVE